MNNNTLDLLESRIRLLVEIITQLHDENQSIKAKLVLTSKEFDTEKRRLEEQLAQAQVGGQTASAYGSDDEISSRLQFQEQQIQLLETERLNLRDQISFLQNTIQNKEKGWKERFSEQENQQGAHSEQISELQERLQTAEDSVLVLRQEITTQKQQANEAQSSLKQENEALSAQLAAVQAQLEAAERIRVEYEQARTEWEKQEHTLLSAANQEKEATEARLLQEAERLRRTGSTPHTAACRAGTHCRSKNPAGSSRNHRTKCPNCRTFRTKQHIPHTAAGTRGKNQRPAGTSARIRHIIIRYIRNGTARHHRTRILSF